MPTDVQGPPSPSVPHEGPGGKVMDFLGKQMGPFPIGIWIVILVGGGAVALLMHRLFGGSSQQDTTGGTVAGTPFVTDSSGLIPTPNDTAVANPATVPTSAGVPPGAAIPFLPINPTSSGDGTSTGTVDIGISGDATSIPGGQDPIMSILNAIGGGGGGGVQHILDGGFGGNAPMPPNPFEGAAGPTGNAITPPIIPAGLYNPLNYSGSGGIPPGPINPGGGGTPPGPIFPGFGTPPGPINPGGGGGTPVPPPSPVPIFPLPGSTQASRAHLNGGPSSNVVGPLGHRT